MCTSIFPIQILHTKMYMFHTCGCMLEKVPAVAECDPSELLMHPVRLQVNASHRGRAVGEAEGGVSVVTLGTETTGSTTPKVGDTLSITVIDADADAAGLSGHHVVTAATSTTVFSVSPGLPASVATDKVSITIVARAQDPKPRVTSLDNTINMYSFALKPEEHQPSGTCNFSRIDTAYLKLSSAATVQNVYALNYNVLRIMSGMGGLAYSN